MHITSFVVKSAIEMDKIIFVVERTNTGFSAYAEDYDIYTTGNSEEDLRRNILEATNLHLLVIGEPPVTGEKIKLKLYETEGENDL
jgi:predicted RNase H-like HicB family nuclease